MVLVKKCESDDDDVIVLSDVDTKFVRGASRQSQVATPGAFFPAYPPHPQAVVRLYNCAECTHSFADRQQLKAHIAGDHLRWLPYRCVHCARHADNRFPTEHTLKTHIWFTHYHIYYQEMKNMDMYNYYYEPNAEIESRFSYLMQKSEASTLAASQSSLCYNPSAMRDPRKRPVQPKLHVTQDDTEKNTSPVKQQAELPNVSAETTPSTPDTRVDKSQRKKNTSPVKQQTELSNVSAETTPSTPDTTVDKSPRKKKKDMTELLTKDCRIPLERCDYILTKLEAERRQSTKCPKCGCRLRPESGDPSAKLLCARPSCKKAGETATTPSVAVKTRKRRLSPVAVAPDSTTVLITPDAAEAATKAVVYSQPKVASAPSVDAVTTADTTNPTSPYTRDPPPGSRLSRSAKTAARQLIADRCAEENIDERAAAKVRATGPRNTRTSVIASDGQHQASNDATNIIPSEPKKVPNRQALLLKYLTTLVPLTKNAAICEPVASTTSGTESVNQTPSRCADQQTGFFSEDQIPVASNLEVLQTTLPTSDEKSQEDRSQLPRTEPEPASSAETACSVPERPTSPKRVSIPLLERERNIQIARIVPFNVHQRKLAPVLMRQTVTPPSATTATGSTIAEVMSSDVQRPPDLTREVSTDTDAQCKSVLANASPSVTQQQPATKYLPLFKSSQNSFTARKKALDKCQRCSLYVAPINIPSHVIQIHCNGIDPLSCLVCGVQSADIQLQRCHMIIKHPTIPDSVSKRVQAAFLANVQWCFPAVTSIDGNVIRFDFKKEEFLKTLTISSLSASPKNPV